MRNVAPNYNLVESASFQVGIQGMLSMLGDPDLQKKTATALQAFLDGGHRLTIRLDPDDIVLLPMLVGAVTMSPKSLVELLGGDISASPVN